MSGALVAEFFAQYRPRFPWSRPLPPVRVAGFERANMLPPSMRTTKPWQCNNIYPALKSGIPAPLNRDQQTALIDANGHAANQAIARVNAAQQANGGAPPPLAACIHDAVAADGNRAAVVTVGGHTIRAAPLQNQRGQALTGQERTELYKEAMAKRLQQMFLRSGIPPEERARMTAAATELMHQGGIAPALAILGDAGIHSGPSQNAPPSVQAYSVSRQGHTLIVTNRFEQERAHVTDMRDPNNPQTHTVGPEAERATALPGSTMHVQQQAPRLTVDIKFEIRMNANGQAQITVAPESSVKFEGLPRALRQALLRPPADANLLP